jgi:hypothetical protein
MNVRQELLNSGSLEVGPERFCPLAFRMGDLRKRRNLPFMPGSDDWLTTRIVAVMTGLESPINRASMGLNGGSISSPMVRYGHGI